MKVLMLTLYDTKAEVYFTPDYARSRAEGIRVFSDMMQDGKYAKHCEDYNLMLVGEFDQLTGVITPQPGGPVVLDSGIAYKGSGVKDLRLAQ